MVSRIQTIIGLLLLLLLAGCGSQPEENLDDLPPEPSAPPAVTGAVVAGLPTTFTVVGDNFKFIIEGKDNPDMRVALGDSVRVELTNTHGLHDWVVDEFNAATAKIRPGNSTYVEFVADKKGVFEYYCSVGSHRANGMKGRLIVE